MGCGGKKNLFPAKRLVFAREQKTRKEVRTDVRLRKRIMKVEGKEKKPYRSPSKKKYLYQGEEKDFGELGANYPYNWYIGGVDTCQGDSGGPMWRNVKTKNGTRATQLGVVARGSYCAWFNS